MWVRDSPDFILAHPGDFDASVYVIDWLSGGPIYHVGRADGERVRLRDSLSQILGWDHRPDAGVDQNEPQA